MARRRFAADLHVHSHLTRACSPLLRPEGLHRWAQLKGVAVLSTGDITHPRWRAELKAKIVEAEEGLWRLSPAAARLADRDVPASCRAQPRFVLGGEVALAYRQGGRPRRVHHLVYAPSWEKAERLAASLEKAGGSLAAEGLPVLGLDSRRLLELCLEAGPGVHLVPAHAWMPRFSIFGGPRGFNSLEECFGDLAPHIFALETGLDSDPAMSRRVSSLDRLSLLSGSDARSLDKIGREATLFDAPLSYRGLFGSLSGAGPGRLLGTVEIRPKADKRRAAGAAGRLEELADRPRGSASAPGPRAERLVPLRELAAETLRLGPASVKAGRLWREALERFGPELFILRELDPRRLEEAGRPLLARALARMRLGEEAPSPGRDGARGKVRFLRDEDFARRGQQTLF